MYSAARRGGTASQNWFVRQRGGPATVVLAWRAGRQLPPSHTTQAPAWARNMLSSLGLVLWTPRPRSRLQAVPALTRAVLSQQAVEYNRAGRTAARSPFRCCVTCDSLSTSKQTTQPNFQFRWKSDNNVVIKKNYFFFGLSKILDECNCRSPGPHQPACL